MRGEFICADCMEYLPNYPDGYFDLAICDPPYGGGLLLTQEKASVANVDDLGNISTVTLKTTRGGQVRCLLQA